MVWSRPPFGDVASAASHDIGARNAIENFEVDQRNSNIIWRAENCNGVTHKSIVLRKTLLKFGVLL